MNQKLSQKHIIIFSVVSVFILFFASACGAANRKKNQNYCTANLSRIGNVIELYASDHDGKLPPTEGCAAILQKVDFKNVEELFKCPTDKKDHYRFFCNEVKKSDIKNSDKTVLAICTADHGDKVPVVFADGHVQLIDKKTIDDGLKELKSGDMFVLP